MFVTDPLAPEDGYLSFTAIVKFPYLFNLAIVRLGLPNGLVDALISNPAVLCCGLLVLLFRVEPISIDVIPLP